MVRTSLARVAESRKKYGWLGQSMLEFALAFPVLLLIIFGIIEFGRIIFIYAAVSTASREGARYGAAVGNNPQGTPRYIDCAGIRNAVRGIGALVGVTDADITISYDHGPGTAVFGSCPVPATSIGLGDRVVVQVRGFYNPPPLPFVNLPTFQMNNVSNRTILKGVSLQQGPTALGPTVTTGGGGSTAQPTDTQEPPTNTPFGPTATNTPVTPTNTVTLTATLPSFPTSTSTPIAPAPPIYDSVAWTKSGSKCNDIYLTWTPNPAWTTYPATSVVQYQLFKNGQFAFVVSPSTPKTTARTYDNLHDSDRITYSVQAIFPGPLASTLMSVTFVCDKGNLIIP